LIGLPERLTKLFTGTNKDLYRYDTYTGEVYDFSGIKLYEERDRIRLYLLHCLKGIFDSIKTPTSTPGPLVKDWATSTTEAPVIEKSTTSTTTTISSTTTSWTTPTARSTEKLDFEETTSATTRSSTTSITKPSSITTQEFQFEDYTESWKLEAAAEIIETTTIVPNTAKAQITTSNKNSTLEATEKVTTKGIFDDYSDFNNTVLLDKPVETDNNRIPRSALAITLVLFIVLIAILITSTLVTIVTSTISKAIQKRKQIRKQRDYTIFEDDWEARPIVKKARHKRSYNITQVPSNSFADINVHTDVNSNEETTYITLNSFKPINTYTL
jgi:hypothetical protein